jgi:hypothetical protein
MTQIRRWTWAAGGALIAVTATTRLHAQTAGDGFLFHTPVGSVTLRAGYDHATAGSDLFSFSTEQLTLKRGDFSGPTMGADVALRITPWLDGVLGVAYTGSKAGSEFRHFVDLDNLPIEQTTRFVRVPATIGLRAYLLPRGRTIGRFAWVPSRVAPYVGAGAGALWYRFRQTGDFIDAGTLAVFNDEFTSSGVSPTAHAHGGLEISLAPMVALTVDGRYTWARAELGDDFARFHRIDLSGFATTAGISIRF